MRDITAVGVVWRLCLLLSAVTAAVWPILAFFDPDPGLLFLARFTLAAMLPPACVLGIVDYGWQRFFMDFPESIRISAAQIRANKMRSALTALGVIIGIVAVTLMGTAILGIDRSVETSLAGFGDDVLYVTKWPWRDVNDWWVYRNRREIPVSVAAGVNGWIASHPEGPMKRAVPVVNWNADVSRGSMEISSIAIIGTTSEYGHIFRSDMSQGRFFTDLEEHSGLPVAVIGYDVAEALFPGESPIGKQIKVRSNLFTVIGVASRQGSFLGIFSWDSEVIMPLDAFAHIFPMRWAHPQIQVQVDASRIQDAKDELRGEMRRLRRLGPERADDFEINSQQVVREQLDPIKQKIAISGLFITGLALFVGAIGIMNITYVSVKERTKEIGTRKALGAPRRTILMQFLIEAVSICIVGGIGGLLLAWAMSAAVGAAFPKFPLVFSTGLVVIGLAISVATGIFSGFAPAWQASKLDPVDALRYE